VPIVAITIWPWGAVATGFVLFGAAFPPRDQMARWGLPVAVLGIWGAVALVSIFAPSIVTGSDQTIVPIAGLFSPVAGAVATGLACLAAAWSECRSGAVERPTSPGRWRPRHGRQPPCLGAPVHRHLRVPPGQQPTIARAPTLRRRHGGHHSIAPGRFHRPSSRLEGGEVSAESVVDFSGDVALQAADDLAWTAPGGYAVPRRRGWAGSSATAPRRSGAIIQTIRRDPSRSLGFDEAPNLRREDPSAADLIDGDGRTTSIIPVHGPDSSPSGSVWWPGRPGAARPVGRRLRAGPPGARRPSGRPSGGSATDTVGDAVAMRMLEGGIVGTLRASPQGEA
jgi:hypothetical protein